MKRLRCTFLRVLGKHWVEFLVLVLYLILTLILLYPFSILNMGNQVIGNSADTYQGLWNLWWVKHSTLSLQSPYFTSYIYYPYGADLYVHTLSPAAGFLTIPFQLAFGIIFSYNLIIILSFILGGYGTYQLAFHITNDKKASFFAGLVFTFSTYHFSRALGHMNLVSIQWIPFYVLFMLKMRHEKTYTNALAATFLLVLTALMADLQYVLFLALFTLFYVAYELVLNRNQFRGFLKRLAITATASAGFIFLYFTPLISGWLSGKYAYAATPASDSVVLSSDLLGFFTPSQFNPLFGSISSRITQSFSTTALYPMESSTYIGYTVLALAVFACIKLRKQVRFWLFSAIAFLILSLGPLLHVMGTIINIPLPEAIILYTVPIFRAPSRFVVMATLCLAVLAATALKQANMSIGRLKNGKILSILFIVVVSASLLAENNFLPYPTIEDTAVPQFYYQLAQINETFAVLDLPQNYSENNLYMYYGTVSEKPLLSGATSKTTPQEILLREAVPLVSQTGYALNGEELMEQTDILTMDLNATNLNALHYFGVKYVILHKNQMNAEAFNILNSYLNNLLGAPCYTDRKITAFEVKQALVQGVFAYLAGNWWNVEAQKGWPTRWMKDNGTIEIFSPHKQFAEISFSAGTQYSNKSLSVNLNSEQVGNYTIVESEERRISTQLLLREGVNTLFFHSNQTYVPAELANSTADNRQLSVYIKNVQIIPTNN